MRLLSTSTPGSGVGSEPVAMMMFFASRVWAAPPPLTSTLPGPAIAPQPFTQSTLFFFIRNSTPLVRAATLSAFWASICLRFSFGVTSMPRLAKSLPAASNSSEACNRALEGMQPTLRQVPPKVDPPSTMAVFSPSWPQRMAAL